MDPAQAIACYLCTVMVLFAPTSTHACDTMSLSSVCDPITIYEGIRKETLHALCLKHDQWETFHPDSLSDVLRDVNGMVVSSAGGMGTPTSLFLRGGNANHTLVLHDGLRIMDPSTPDGAFNAGVVNLNSCDTLTVNKGPLSSLFGEDAMTGVISLSQDKGVRGIPKNKLSFISTDGMDRALHKITTAHGSFGTHHTTFTTRGQRRRVHYNVTVDHLKTQGHRVYPPYVGGAFPIPSKNPYHTQGAQGRFDVDVGRHSTLTWNAHESSHQQCYRSSDNVHRTGRTQRHHHALALKSRHTFSWGGSYHQKILMGFAHTRRHDRETHPNTQEGFIAKGLHEQLTWQGSLRYQKYSLQSEIDYSKQSLNQRKVPLNANGDFTRDYVHQRTHSYSVMLAPAYRTSFGRHHMGIKGALRRSMHHAFHTQDTGMVSIEYTAPTRTRTRMTVSYGTAYKSPTLYHMYAHTPWYTGNAALRPERSRGIECGITQPIDHTLSIRLRAFRQSIRHMLTMTPPSNPARDTWMYVNSGKAEIKGTEGEIAWRYEGWRITAQYTHLWTHDHRTHQGLQKRPNQIYGLQGSYTHDAWTHALNIHYKGRSLATHPITFHIDHAKGYCEVDCHTTYHISPKRDIFLKITNVLNQRRHEDPLGYLRPGLSVQVGASIIL